MEQAVVSGASTASDGKIICHIDNQRVHSIQLHIKQNHADTWTVERYKEEFPEAALLSDVAKAAIEKRSRELQPVAPVAKMSTSSAMMSVAFSTLHDVFDLGNAPAALSTSGSPIQISVMADHDDQSLMYLPRVDPSYIYSIDLLKKVIIGFELNMPVYLWGYHGTGKTTILQQAAARTKRPFVRVQHTINMQESDVLGQWTVKDGSTQFQLGPLPMAMLNGWVYCADEYDFAMPSVTSVYQPVLEGEALLIKDAPPVFRKIEPHPQFRFCATGNTNGVGDESGLYQGTLIQNAASYSRFRITEEVKYMTADIEESILSAKSGAPKDAIKKIVKFANTIREMFADQKISMTVSPRELIGAAILGMSYGGNWEMGLNLSFCNRLSRVDREVVQQYMQRVFGK